MQSLAVNSSLPLSFPLHHVEAAEWVRMLAPAPSNSNGSSWSVEPASPSPQLERMIELVGAGPVHWAVQIGDQIARFLHRRYPHWAGIEAEHRANRVGPECMALVSLEFLATGRFRSGKVTVAVADMMKQRHALAIPLNELVQSSSDIHSRLAQEYLHACEQFVQPEHQFAAARAVSKVLLACAREYTDSLVSFHAAPRPAQAPARSTRAVPAIRRQLVSELLRGVEATLTDVEKKIGYPIADRPHRALVVWSNPDDPDETERMDDFTAELIDRAGRSSILAVDRPTAGETWLWWNEADDGIRLSDLALPPGVRAVTATVGHGLAGFRLSHARATEVRRAAGSFVLPHDRVVDYDSISGVLPFVENLAGAAAFVVDELGQLAAPGVGGEAQRLTLATLLRTQSVSATARELFITRSTVTYRLQRAEMLLPPGWKNRPMEVALALRLFELLGLETMPDRLSTGGAVERARAGR